MVATVLGADPARATSAENPEEATMASPSADSGSPAPSPISAILR